MNTKKVIKSVIPQDLFRKISPYWHLVEAVIAQNKYGFPARKLKVIGVTGTDGKSTTATLIAAMLRSSGYRVGLMTTVNIDYADGRGEQANPTNLTTGNAFQIAKIIKKIADNNAEYLVLESSSHALHQHRIWGVPISIAVLTNMSPEHLDYHGTFENYRKAKELLFRQCNSNKKGLQTGIINADDAVAHYFKSDISKPLTYGIEKGSLKASKIKNDLHGNSFFVNYKGKTYNLHTQLIGAFNTYNALAALGVGVALGLTKQQIEQGIASMYSMPGRMMSIHEGQKYKVIIDYAVTPGAIKAVLTTLRALSKNGKLIIVFGATGDRDKSKRPEMGKIASELADYVLITDDETYTEDPNIIREAVYAGVSSENRNKVEVITDRKEAIKAALTQAKTGDVIVITGIGHQTARNMGGKKEKWSDIEVTKTLIKQQKK